MTIWAVSDNFTKKCYPVTAWQKVIPSSLNKKVPIGGSMFLFKFINDQYMKNSKSFSFWAIFEKHKMKCYPVTNSTDFSGMLPHAISRENPYQCKLCTKSFGQCGNWKETCEYTYRRKTLSMQILYKIFLRWWTVNLTFENTFR